MKTCPTISPPRGPSRHPILLPRSAPLSWPISIDVSKCDWIVAGAIVSPVRPDLPAARNVRRTVRQDERKCPRRYCEGVLTVKPQSKRAVPLVAARQVTIPEVVRRREAQWPCRLYALSPIECYRVRLNARNLARSRLATESHLASRLAVPYGLAPS